MSIIGKHPIAIPAGVDVTIDGSTVTVKMWIRDRPHVGQRLCAKCRADLKKCPVKRATPHTSVRDSLTRSEHKRGTLQ